MLLLLKTTGMRFLQTRPPSNPTHSSRLLWLTAAWTIWFNPILKICKTVAVIARVTRLSCQNCNFRSGSGNGQVRSCIGYKFGHQATRQGLVESVTWWPKLSMELCKSKQSKEALEARDALDVSPVAMFKEKHSNTLPPSFLQRRRSCLTTRPAWTLSTTSTSSSGPGRWMLLGLVR